MSTTQLDVNRMYLGIDGGGSKCKAILVDVGTGKLLGTGLAGAANPFNNYELAIASIVLAAQRALEEAKVDSTLLASITAGIGLAGVNIPESMVKMQQWLHPFKQIFVTTDLEVACLGAHNGEDGAIIIAGTGSCGFSMIDKALLTIGGHGFPHGDKGSGAWLGLQVVKKVLLSLDGLAPPSLMTPLLLNQLNCENTVQLIDTVAKQTSTFFAQLAFIVFEAARQQDTLALDIVNEGAQYINCLAQRLLKDNPPRLSLIGGLTPVLSPWLDETLQQQLEAPIFAPEMGAIIFAQQQFTSVIK